MNTCHKQADQFLKDCGAKMSIEYDRCDTYFGGDTAPRDIYNVVIDRNGERYSFRFGNSLRATQSGDEPTAYYILSCLQKYEPETDVWDFAHEYGYEINSRESYESVNKIHGAVCREWLAVNQLFGDVLEQLREIE
jgi:hypothetical protein